MSIILHHYPSSPWAELVRLALGYKGVPWFSCVQPNMLPKPDQVALTGGYARTPVLQIGADVYCDTTAIIEALETHPPTLYPEAEHRALAAEVQGPLFFAAVGAAMGDLPARGMESFWEDRRKRFGMEPEGFRQMVPMLKARFAQHLDTLEARLRDGRRFMTGDALGHGDLAHYQLVWFQGMTTGGDLSSVLEGRPSLAAWAERVAAVGHGSPQPMTPGEALRVARDAEPVAAAGPVQEPGFVAEQMVSVAQEGCNDPPVVGKLAAMDARHIMLLREGPEVGTVAVHFPRLGQRVTPV